MFWYRHIWNYTSGKLFEILTKSCRNPNETPIEFAQKCSDRHSSVWILWSLHRARTIRVAARMPSFRVGPGRRGCSSAAHSVHGASNFAALYKDQAMPEQEENHSSKPSQTIYFIRHCEGEHNAACAAGEQASYLIADALLTARGTEQAAAIAHNTAFSGHWMPGAAAGECEMPELVVASPMRRTMQTAMLAFGSLHTPPSFVLRAELMENGLSPSDTPCPDLGFEMLAQSGWQQLCDEYAALPAEWHIKGSQWRKSVLTRFATLLSWLQTRPERKIAIVGHHGFYKSTLGEDFALGEVRAFKLEGGNLRDLSGRPSDSGGALRMKIGLKLAGLCRSPKRALANSVHGATNFACALGDAPTDGPTVVPTTPREESVRSPSRLTQQLLNCVVAAQTNHHDTGFNAGWAHRRRRHSAPAMPRMHPTPALDQLENGPQPEANIPPPATPPAIRGGR